MWYEIFTLIIMIGAILTYLCKRGSDKVKFYLKYFILYFGASLIAAMLLPYNMLKARNAINIKKFTAVMKYVNRIILDLEYEIRNEEFLNEEGGAVLIGNHQSAFDTCALCHIWNHVKYAITALIKKEIFYVWPFGLSAYFAGVIFIDRKNTRNAYKVLQETRDLMINKKVKIWFFPEGTRNKDYTKLLPFKKGAFNLAVEAQVPIIPIVFSPYNFIDHKKHVFGKGHVVIQCLEPVSTKGLTKDDVPDLIKLCYDKMTRACETLAQEFNSKDS